MARAIYEDAEIYLLDDPLAAVDSHVANEIYNNCINGFLADKTRILITHRIKHLETAHNIVLLENRKVVDQGNWNDLVEKGNHVFLKKLKEERESEGLSFLLKKGFAQFIADETVY